MRINDLLNVLIQFNDGLRNLIADIDQTEGDCEHHSQGEDGKGHDKLLENIVLDLISDTIDFVFNN